MRNRYETRRAKGRRRGYEVFDRQTGKVVDSCGILVLCEETRKHLEGKHREAKAKVGVA